MAWLITGCIRGSRARYCPKEARPQGPCRGLRLYQASIHSKIACPRKPDRKTPTTRQARAPSIPAETRRSITGKTLLGRPLPREVRRRLPENLNLRGLNPVLSPQPDQLGTFLRRHAFLDDLINVSDLHPPCRHDSLIPRLAASCATGFSFDRASATAVRRNSTG